MKFSTIITALVILLSGVSISGQGYFDWSKQVLTAYDHAVALRLAEAESAVSKAEKSEPANVMRYLVAHYIDFFNVFVSGNEMEKQNMLTRANRRLRATELADDGSPYSRYNRAQIHLMNAMVRSRFKSYLGAFRDISVAFTLLEENQSLYPDFAPNNVSFGALRALIGTVPEKYNWGISLLGLEGDIHDGRQQVFEAMQIMLEEGHPMSREAIVVTAMIDLHLIGDKAGAWALVKEKLTGEAKSPLIAFLKANVAHHAGENEAVLKILGSAPKGKDYEDYAFLDYMHGCSMLYDLDPSADDYLKRFLEKDQSGLYHKDASLKLVWHDHLFNGGKKVEEYRLAGMASGSDDHVIDAYAQQSLENWQGYQPDLLRARLLFDGGYYERALAALHPYPILESQEEALEAAYRLGRTYFSLEQYPQALIAFEKAMSFQKKSSHHHVAFAYYWSARTYEVMGRIQKARDLYRWCLKINTDAYEDSLRQKAKAGLERTEVHVR
jgi:tetratricopeptide (TPR) repeat protein